MSFYGPGGAAHSSERDDWETPRDVFERCDEVWHFELDAASNDENALCERHFTKEQDGLKQEWGGYASGAIPHMVGKSESGSRRRGTSRTRTARSSSCFFPPARTRDGFTTTARGRTRSRCCAVA